MNDENKKRIEEEVDDVLKVVEMEEETPKLQSHRLKDLSKRDLFKAMLILMATIYIVHTLISIAYAYQDKAALPILYTESNKLLFFVLGIFTSKFYENEKKSK